MLCVERLALPKHEWVSYKSMSSYLECGEGETDAALLALEAGLVIMMSLAGDGLGGIYSLQKAVNIIDDSTLLGA